MKTIFSLAIIGTLLFTSCKKAEIQDIEPVKQSTSLEPADPTKKLTTPTNNLNTTSPEDANNKYY
jgi:hypothetical protein